MLLQGTSDNFSGRLRQYWSLCVQRWTCCATNNSLVYLLPAKETLPGVIMQFSKRTGITGEMSGTPYQKRDDKASTKYLKRAAIFLCNILQWLLLEVFSLKFGILCKQSDYPSANRFLKMTCFIRGDEPLNRNYYWHRIVLTRTFVFTRLILPLNGRFIKWTIKLYFISFAVAE